MSRCGALTTLVGLWLGCGGPAPPPTDRAQALGADSPRATTLVKPFGGAEVLPDTGPPPPPTPTPPPTDTLPLLSAADAAPFETRAVHLLDTLRHAGPLQTWSRTHPEETIERAEDHRDFDAGFGLPVEGAWCARAVRRERLRDGRMVLRSVFFYPPDSAAPVPGGEAPVDRAPIAECLAGAISIETPEPDPTAGDSLALALRRRLTARHGSGRIGARLATWRASDWRASTFWRVSSASVVAAAEGAAPVGRVFLLAWEPSSGIAGDLTDARSLRADPETTMLRELLSLGPLDSARAERLIGFRTRAYWAGEGVAPDTLTEAGLRAALEPWVRAADTLPPRAQSAALLLADRVLAVAGLSLVAAPESASTRAWLERLGARFQRQPLGGDYTYANNWLWEAYRKEGDGPIGQRALLVLLRYGLHTGPGCGGDEGYRDEEFRRVIAEGGRALEGPLDAGLRPEIERLVAEAFGDIVYLAAGGGYASEYFEPADYRSESPEARRNAIEHYDAALRLTAAGATRTRLWHAAWRLQAGLAPLVPHFICVYD